MVRTENWFDVIVLHIQFGHSDCPFSSLKLVLGYIYVYHFSYAAIRLLFNICHRLLQTKLTTENLK